MLGTLGSLLVLAAFVASVVAGGAFVQAVRRPAEAAYWKRIGRWGWVALSAATVVAFALLVTLFVQHDYRYAYVYQHSSNDLPGYFTVAAAWAGQEGSFLLWIVFNALLGLGLIRWGSRRVGGPSDALRAHFEAPVMAVFALGQFFLLAMIAGVKLGPLSVGSSPFLTLVAKYPDAPFLQAGGVPADGNGLNDLLQNYWMTIHPPTLFVGFAAMMVPFAFAVAALWTRRYTEWVRLALPWTLFATLVLGVGIILGGYWAYVTLSFGGYWAWDPVENSSLVPWLIGIAAIHAMIVQKRSAAGHKSALLLSIAAFMFVVYSTFLTRSGILGDMSVHSFVDLGLYNQLLLWILTMGVLGFGLFAYRYRELPAPKTPPATLSRESMIFTGALILTLLALVIIVGTSAPILGRIFRDNPAAVAIEFYNTWTLPLAVIVAALAGLGQLFWWKKMTVENVNRALLKPLALSVAATALVLVFTPFVPETTRPAAVAAAGPQAIEAGIGLGGFWDVYGQGLLVLLLLFAAFFALFGNGAVLWRIARGNLKMAGGSITHIGFALMLLGIVASSIFSDPLTDGQGANLRGDRDNFIVQRGETKEVEGFSVTYAGMRTNERGRSVYDLDVAPPNGRPFRASAEVYQSKTEQWIQHPHVQPFFGEDLYVAVFPAAMMGQPQGRAPGELLLRRGETASLQPAQAGGAAYAVRFTGYDLNVDPAALPVGSDALDLAVGAALDVTNAATGETRSVRPVYMILTDRSQQFVPAEIPEWGLALTFAGMQVESDAVQIVVEGAEVAAEDWVVVQAYRKPLINLLWFGTFVLAAGFVVSIVRRAQEQRGRRAAGDE